MGIYDRENTDLSEFDLKERLEEQIRYGSRQKMYAREADYHVKKDIVTGPYLNYTGSGDDKGTWIVFDANNCSKEVIDTFVAKLKVFMSK